MAKMGEGDKRWIVEDRPDGTNVHNWHWAETDCLDWSRKFLSNLLTGKPILSGEGNLYIKIKNVEKLEGEAYVNVRKGKIIPGYELNLVLSYEAKATDSDGGAVLLVTEGSVEVPYISDENAGEDPEIRITIKDDGPVGRRLKEAFVVKGKPFVFEKIREYVTAIAEGGPAKDDLQVKKVVPEKKSASGTDASTNNPGSKEVKKKEETKKEGFKSITMSEKFSCRASDLYDILLDENRWKGFTQSNAKISKEVGGEFTIFDGSVTGKNLELEAGKLIVQEWDLGVGLMALFQRSGLLSRSLNLESHASSSLTQTFPRKTGMVMLRLLRTLKGDGETISFTGSGLFSGLVFEVASGRRIVGCCVYEFFGAGLSHL